MYVFDRSWLPSAFIVRKAITEWVNNDRIVYDNGELCVLSAPTHTPLLCSVLVVCWYEHTSVRIFQLKQGHGCVFTVVVLGKSAVVYSACLRVWQACCVFKIVLATRARVSFFPHSFCFLRRVNLLNCMLLCLVEVTEGWRVSRIGW